MKWEKNNKKQQKMKVYGKEFFTGNPISNDHDKRLTEEIIKPQVATIGFFDGVHRGHCHLIDHVRSVAEASGMESMAVTFDNHPRRVLDQDYCPQMLSTLDDKLLLLSKAHIDNCAVLPFCRSLASLSAHEFMQKILHDKLNVRKLVIGYDNRFGHDRTDGFEDYARYGREMGIEVICSDAYIYKGVRVSSSVVRSYIAKGEIRLANDCLGHPYTITGKVVGGFREGRKIGFPTANIAIDDPCRMIPANGVYAVTVRIPGSMEQKHAMMNIGKRPTYNGHEVTLEAHILNFRGDIYGQTVSVSFISRIRDERKFADIEELTHQLHEDERIVEEILKNEIE